MQSQRAWERKCSTVVEGVQRGVCTVVTATHNQCILGFTVVLANRHIPFSPLPHFLFRGAGVSVDCVHLGVSLHTCRKSR